MYKVFKIEGTDYIKVGDFVVAEIKFIDDRWCAIVKNKYNNDGMLYYNKKRKKAIEGLLRQMIYKTYNDILEDL